MTSAPCGSWGSTSARPAVQRLLAEPAFILHRRQYSESSLLLEVLTPARGRLGMLARGARGGRSGLAAALQPFQELRVDASGAGELLRLTRAEAVGGPVALVGERALAGLYCNELVVRFLPRADPSAAAFERYRQVLIELADAPAPAWPLRRFERDLLALLGYGIDYGADADGAGLDPAAHYRLQPERGFVAVAEGVGGYPGSALLALAQDQPPEASQLRAMRGLLRDLLGAQLTGAPLRSWRLLSELPRVQRGGLNSDAVADAAAGD